MFSNLFAKKQKRLVGEKNVIKCKNLAVGIRLRVCAVYKITRLRHIRFFVIVESLIMKILIYDREKLQIIIRAYPEIYQLNTLLNYGLARTNEIWDNIADEYGDSVQNVRKYWHSLLNLYRKAIKKPIFPPSLEIMRLYMS